MGGNENKINEDNFYVGVIGSGKMGTCLFNYILDFEFPLVWICEFEDDVKEITKGIQKRLNRLERAGLKNQEWYENRIHQIKVSHEPHDLIDCNLIIETITEDVSLKKDLFTSLDQIVGTDCIFASNSSSISPEDWSPGGGRKEKVVGMHFFFPVQFTNITELIITRNTSKNTIRIAKNFLRLINRKFLLQNEESAFLLNKLFIDLQAGSYNLCIEKSLSFREMDNIIVGHLFPVGVFELFDRIGIDVIHYSINRYTRKRDNQKFYQPLLHCMENMIAENKRGMKTGEGFYKWEGQQKIHPVNVSSSGEISIDDDSVIVQLKEWYVNTAKQFVEKGYCTVSELDYAVREYMNCEKGPFEI